MSSEIPVEEKNNHPIFTGKPSSFLSEKKNLPAVVEYSDWPGPFRSDGAPDMRFTPNKQYALNTKNAPAAAAAPPKTDHEFYPDKNSSNDDNNTSPISSPTTPTSPYEEIKTSKLEYFPLAMDIYLHTLLSVIEDVHHISLQTLLKTYRNARENLIKKVEVVNIPRTYVTPRTYHRKIKPKSLDIKSNQTTKAFRMNDIIKALIEILATEHALNLEDLHLTVDIFIALSEGSITREKFKTYVMKKNENNPDKYKIAMTLFEEDPVTAVKWYALGLLKSV